MCPAPAPPEGSGADTQPITRTPAQPEPGFAAGPRRRRTGVVLRIAIAIVVAGAAVGAFVFLHSGNTATPNSTHPPTATKPPPRLAFAFHVNRLHTVSLSGRSAKSRATDAANAIAQKLSAFYDHAFADPTSWKSGVPDNAWHVFAASIRDRAKSEANSFAPATTGVNLVSLTVTKSRLSVSVLFDNAGRPEAAFADVIFEGTGQLKGGEKVTVDNAATFLFRPTSGTWFIVGYPHAKTTVEAGTGSPSASASPSSGSSP